MTSIWLIATGLAGLLLIVLLFWPWQGRCVDASPSGDGYQEAHIVIGADAFHPRRVRVKAGYPVRLTFYRQPEAPACTGRLHLLAFGKKVYFDHTAQAQVELFPASPGTFTFSCALGRMKGALIVSEHLHSRP